MTPTILLVDDDNAFRTSVAQVLELEDYDFIQVSSGKECLEILNSPSSSSIQLLISDILMPEMEGIELNMEIRKLRPDLKTIGMTGGGKIAISEIESSAKVFFDSFLTKPFSADQLIQEVQKYTNPSTTH
jgi:DNA-binding NtrC family response regulator